MIEISQITPDFAIGPQPEAADIADLAKAGFRSILNARPDDEAGTYLVSSDARALAGDAGLAYAHAPTGNHAIFEDQAIDNFEQAMVDLPGPVFAHCKSGTRAAILWALVASRHRPVEEVIETLRTAGQELDFLEQELRDAASSASRSPLRLRDDGLMKLGQSRLLRGN